ncbi:hypothetical protein CH251_21585 [Rhodococcus sp. 06-462-5]|nr:hypothetical protein CH251_21585 [Rhodococcus sp. 06-462-5]OZE65173.1 hypothetical protein CH270_14260 [Rhodococcus sp. 02-925g]
MIAAVRALTEECRALCSARRGSICLSFGTAFARPDFAARCQVGVDGVGLADSMPFGTVGSGRVTSTTMWPLLRAARLG